MALLKLRPEARRELDLHDSWIDPEVHEDASPNHALDNRETHVCSSR
jgi:hypothetical protein